MNSQPDPRVPAYLGRVLDSEGNPAGTCFQLFPGILVTAYHVLEDLQAVTDGDIVDIDPLAGGGAPFPATVAATAPLHDLAVLRTRASTLSASVPGAGPTDAMVLGEPVAVTGASHVEDVHTYRFLDTLGSWQGAATRDDAIALGRLEAKALMKGMSGAPVRNDVVVGVVSGRYKSADGWLAHSVWVARTEDLQALLKDIAPPRAAPTPPWSHRPHAQHRRHRGPPPGRRQGHFRPPPRRGRGPCGWGQRHPGRPGPPRATRHVTPGTEHSVAELALSRAGELLAASFLPPPISEALRDFLRQAEAHNEALRIGIEVTGALAALPWEALPDPLGAIPLALHPLVTVYRKAPAPSPMPIPGPLRILVAISAPDQGGGATLDYEAEQRAVLSAVRSARQGSAHVRIVAYASTAAIKEALTEEPAHVLHLSGHGSPGSFVFEDDDGKARPLDADTFLNEAIPPGAMPPLIALAACHTDAQAAAAEPSFAARLLRRGASVVIATETSVSDRYATRVFSRVYGHLAGASTPDPLTAVADARREVQRELAASHLVKDKELACFDEWATLAVLAPHGSLRLFDPATTEPIRARPAPSVGSLLARAPGEFVGRRPEQRRWPGEFVGPTLAGIVLHGIGGAGKTTLAAELARRVLERDPARALAVISGATTPQTLLDQVSASLQRHVALRPQGTFSDPIGQALAQARRVDLAWSDRLAYLRDYVLAEVPLLVVLDNSRTT